MRQEKKGHRREGRAAPNWLPNTMTTTNVTQTLVRCPSDCPLCCFPPQPPTLLIHRQEAGKENQSASFKTFPPRTSSPAYFPEPSGPCTRSARALGFTQSGGGVGGFNSLPQQFLCMWIRRKSELSETNEEKVTCVKSTNTGDLHL